MPNKPTQRFAQAKLALKAAESRFNYATGPYVDAAALELRAAELRFSAAISESRSLFCLDPLDKPANRGRPC